MRLHRHLAPRIRELQHKLIRHSRDAADINDREPAIGRVSPHGIHHIINRDPAAAKRHAALALHALLIQTAATKGNRAFLLIRSRQEQAQAALQPSSYPLDLREAGAGREDRGDPVEEQNPVCSAVVRVGGVADRVQELDLAGGAERVGFLGQCAY